MKLFKTKNDVDEKTRQDVAEEQLDIAPTDVLKSFTVNEKVEDTVTATTDVAEVTLEDTDTVEETLEAQTPEAQTTNITINGADMNEVNIKDIMAKVQNFLSGSSPEDVSNVPVVENGEQMTQENTNELEKAQEDLKVANEKAEALETAKSAVEAEKLALQEQINTMNAEKEAERIKAEKVELSQLIEKELSFVGGTIEDNTDKLFELKSALAEKTELFDFVVDSLKTKSAVIEDSLDEQGSNPKKSETLSVDEQIDQLVQAKLAENKGMREAVAYVQVLEENETLKNAVYGNIGKEQAQEQEEE